MNLRCRDVKVTDRQAISAQHLARLTNSESMPASGHVPQ
jgi:hypothetical protein